MDTNTVERKWQRAWSEHALFVPQRNGEKYLITIPYPYISGSLHIGHARVVTEADVYSRFLRMQGKNVLFPIAFHISGTPVLGISTAIKQGDKKKIDLYTSYVRNYCADEKKVQQIVKTFEEPQNIVDFFIPKMKEEFSSLGLGVDWTRSFTSGDVEHQRLVEWQFHKYEQAGYLVRGKYPVLFSTLYDNAVGEDDISDGDTIPVDKQEFTLIKFEYEYQGKAAFITAATLRPETMYGQTNIWVNPDVDYVVAQVGDELWILSEPCAVKLSYQDRKVERKNLIKGKDLIGHVCKAPFVDRNIPILPSKHCDPDIGTGIVTSVPSDAPFDYVALKELQDNQDYANTFGLDQVMLSNIALIPIIATKQYGKFPGKEAAEKLKITSLSQHNELEQATVEVYRAGFHTGILLDTCGPYVGLSVSEAKEKMKEQLLSSKQAEMFWETSRKATDRSGGKIIVAILDNQWFLDFNAKGWKEKAHECLDQLELVPDKYRKRFGDVFDWLDKRPCARKRGLGTKLPQDPAWVIESLSDSTLYMTLYTIKSKLAQFGINGDQLTLEFFDFVYLGKGRVGPVSDSTGIKKEHLEELRAQFEYWYPNDHRHTFAAHLANHLSFSIFAHAGIMPKNRWPKRYSFHGMVISDGQKMSKSKGNVVTLLDVREKYGADTFRASMCSLTSVESTFNWSTDEIMRLKSHLANVYTVISSMKTSESAISSPYSLSFVSWFERAIGLMTSSLESMDLRTYANVVLFELFNRYKKTKARLGDDELSALHTRIKKKWIVLLSPLVPHLAEELFQEYGEGFASLAPWPKRDESLIDEKAEMVEELQEQLTADIRTVIQLAKVQNPSLIKIITAHSWKYDFFKELKEQESRDASVLLKYFLSKNEFKRYGQDIVKLLPTLLKDSSRIPKVVLDGDQEFKLFTDAVEVVGKVFSCSVVVQNGDESSEHKAKSAMPGKPGIVVE